MTTANPYAPPQASAAAGWSAAPSSRSYRTEGELLVIDKGAALPDICILTGKPTEGDRMKRTLQWVPPWLAALVLLSPIIYFIVFFIVRKTGEVSFAVSAEARRRRTNGILMGVGGSLLSVAVMFIGMASDSGGLTMIGVVGLIAAIIAGALSASLFRLKKIDEHHIYLQLKPAARAAFERG